MVVFTTIIIFKHCDIILLNIISTMQKEMTIMHLRIILNFIILDDCH